MSESRCDYEGEINIKKLCFLIVLFVIEHRTVLEADPDPCVPVSSYPHPPYINNSQWLEQYRGICHIWTKRFVFHSL